MKPEIVFSYTDINFYTLDIKLPFFLKKKIQDTYTIDKKNLVDIKNNIKPDIYQKTYFSNIDSGHKNMHGNDINSQIYRLSKKLYSFNSKIESICCLSMKNNTSMKPHIDFGLLTGRDGRKICLSWAISPSFDKFSPTIFYDENKDEIYRHYYDEKCFIIDTRILHGVENNNNERVLFQLTFESEICDLI